MNKEVITLDTKEDFHNINFSSSMEGQVFNVAGVMYKLSVFHDIGCIEPEYCLSTIDEFEAGGG